MFFNDWTRQMPRYREVRALSKTSGTGERVQQVGSGEVEEQGLTVGHN